jgi:hypothetical protein
VTGNWSTVDPLWPNEASYGYVGGRPTKELDPSGMGSCNRKWGACESLTLLLQLMQDCIKKGTILCYSGQIPNGHPDYCNVCCGVCYTPCDEITKLGGVLCNGFNESAMKACAERAIRRFLNRGDSIDPKSKPKIDPSKNCPDCTPPGRPGLHYQWNCKPKSKGVITANCCACYRNGEIRMVCYSGQGCHNDRPGS